ncbi:C6 zinc finger domain-containing protein [Nannizzia gypsea CBS 118893]|uniref:C6 zinc finger domain-containing protein n=1 Tax=Arthroderma gypseum (strain ATCC MYA-4604 / CBS 118893) TaxID=535722 RepID=E4V2D0_ARTGP|nr:C6 zinc finger domain-containing protein [Nannizzia gypsea CBS 118893]EFR04195.1 C6 zinc finger domain-containing protein [Nannizzia gypsea CBS 118893]
MESPAPKRRRPAVVCIDCRRRKVKCDRSFPCSQCTQSSLTCAYRGLPGPMNTWPNDHLSSSTLHRPLSSTGTDQSNAPDSTLFTPSELVPFWDSPSNTLDQPVDSQVMLESSNAAQYVAATSSGNGSSPPAAVDNCPLQHSTSNSSIIQSLGSSWRSVSKGSSLEENKNYIQATLDGVDFLFKDAISNPSDKHVEIVPLITKCRQLAKTIKAKRSTDRSNGFAGVSTLPQIPPKQICDRLVYLYTHTFESVFRILHVPSFQREYQVYWNNPLDSSEVFMQKLLLVMTTGISFYEEPENAVKAHQQALHSLASKWVYGAQEWLCHKFEMSEVDLDVLQVSCLLSVARLTAVEASELVWISAEFPLRIAISLQLHRDPHYIYPAIPVFEAEMRKRLWATVLEISTQLSLDSGMPPPISSGDFDYQLPWNIDDSQIDIHGDIHASVDSLDNFTQTTIQILLMKTIRTRLKIARLINAFTPSRNYQDTLQLSSELTAAIRSHSTALQSYISKRPNYFQIKVFHIFTRRFLLALHAPFAAKAKSDPSVYFSRQCVTETALVLLSDTHPPHTSQVPTSEVSHSRVLSCGVFRHMLWQASVIICVELVNGLQEDSFPMTHSLSHSKFQETIEQSTEVFVQRLRAGDTNVEAYVLCSCALAQVKAIQEGKDVKNHVMKAAKSSLDFCYKTLEAHSGYIVQHSSLPRTAYSDTRLQEDNNSIFAEWLT